MGSPAAAIPADSGASPASAAPASAEPVASPAASSNAGSLPASPESPNIRQLREQYETTKAERDKYAALGKLEDLATHSSLATKLMTHAVEVGTALGYDEATIREALLEDPDGTLAFLRTKQAEAEKASGQDPRKEFEKILDKRLKPFEQERENALNDKAQARYDSAFDQHFAGITKDAPVSDGEKSALYDVASYLFQGDDAAMKRLKFEGKTSDVAKFVDQGRKFLDDYYLARTARDQKRTGETGQVAGKPAGAKKFTLDQMIDDPSLINPKYV